MPAAVQLLRQDPVLTLGHAAGGTSTEMVPWLRAPMAGVTDLFLNGHPRLGGQLFEILSKSHLGNLLHLPDEHGLGHSDVMPQEIPAFAGLSLRVTLKQLPGYPAVHAPTPFEELRQLMVAAIFVGLIATPAQ